MFYYEGADGPDVAVVQNIAVIGTLTILSVPPKITVVGKLTMLLMFPALHSET
jgi:hypothetical protein